MGSKMAMVGWAKRWERDIAMGLGGEDSQGARSREGSRPGGGEACYFQLCDFPFPSLVPSSLVRWRADVA